MAPMKTMKAPTKSKSLTSAASRPKAVVKRIAKPKQSSKTSSGSATVSAPAPPGHAPAPPPAHVRSTAVVKLEKPEKPARTNCETTATRHSYIFLFNVLCDFASKYLMAQCLTYILKLHNVNIQGQAKGTTQLQGELQCCKIQDGIVYYVCWQIARGVL